MPEKTRTIKINFRKEGKRNKEVKHFGTIFNSEANRTGYTSLPSVSR